LAYYHYRLFAKYLFKGLFMTIPDIKKELSRYLGKHIRLHERGDRNRMHTTDGLLDGLYPAVFTVLVQKEGRVFHCAFSYRDILMQRLSLSLLPEPLEYDEIWGII